jgi:hypothetical protein
MATPDFMEYLAAAKSLLDIFKGIRSELPKESEVEKVQKKIEEAESALKNSEAVLAKKLGFRLCKCSFPPQIMLWHAAERSHVCPACGDRFARPQPTNDYEDEFISVRR